MKSMYLPQPLACKIIELQVTMQEREGLSRESVLELIECYTNAVEYYNQKGDDRRNKYYQRKMQDFLQQPSITQVLQKGKKSQLTLRKEKTEEEVRRMSTQTQLMAKQIMQNLTEESRKQQNALKLTLAKQEQSLQERIERKRANSNRVGRPKMISSSFTCGQDSPSEQRQMLSGSFIDLPTPPRKQP